MPVLAYIEHSEGKFKKSAFELVSYSKTLAKNLGTTLTALVVGKMEAGQPGLLAQYGADTILTISDPGFTGFANKAYSALIAQAALKADADVVMLLNSFTGKGLAPRVAVKLDAGLISGTADLPKTDAGKFIIRTSTFSGKAIAETEVLATKKVVTLNPNSYPASTSPGSGIIEELKGDVQTQSLKEMVKDIVVSTGKISLPEAEIVVSAGRGLKGPENWAMIEELAAVLGAATACSKPVSDSGWRPHEEHVGQTGITVSPKLYIAIGISGAIQHLAGVSSSKTIVVINKDPEAPFFKVADYGIVGDAFDVVPRFTAALKAYKDTL